MCYYKRRQFSCGHLVSESNNKDSTKNARRVSTTKMSAQSSSSRITRRYVLLGEVGWKASTTEVRLRGLDGVFGLGDIGARFMEEN